MILDHFQLREAPFSIAPDPRYLFMSEQHREALAHLLYGTRGSADGQQGAGGFVLLTGEIGAGKTTLCRCFLEQLPAHCDVAYIFNPLLSAWEMLDAICQEFHIPVRARHVVQDGEEGIGAEDSGRPAERPSVRDYVDALNDRLLETHAQGRASVLIIDEAQNLSVAVLEQLRLLTNLETHRSKLLQIILIGQPELRDIVARPELRQLAQRIIARYHLDALSEEETARYVRHRLAVAGLRDGVVLFPSARLRQIHRLTGGVPRRINLLCDRALLGASVEGHRQVDGKILARAASELAGDARPRPRRRVAMALASSVTVAAVAAACVIALAPSAQPLRDRLLASAHGESGTTGGGALAPVMPAVAAAATSPQKDGGNHLADRTTAASAAKAAAPVAKADTAGAAAGNQATATIVDTAADVSAPAGAASPDAALRPGNALGPLLQASPWKDANQAMQALAALWNPGSRLIGGGACAQLLAADLRCHVGHGGLAELRRLDRPALVNLRSENGQTVPVLLTALSATQAEVRNASLVARIDVMALSQRMTPDFLTLWRLPRTFRDRLLLNDRGADVDWLARRLMPDGHRAANAAFDRALEDRVRAFQTAQGLQPDGIVGPQTLMQLDIASGDREPSLRAGLTGHAGQTAHPEHAAHAEHAGARAAASRRED